MPEKEKKRANGKKEKEKEKERREKKRKKEEKADIGEKEGRKRPIKEARDYSYYKEEIRGR